MSNKFYFDDSDSTNSSTDNLPYPKPLARSAFLTNEFDPNEFLSSLSDRHQTLEDLRIELRNRNQDLSKELLDLVNENYEDFLGLGSSLRGGDDKVEEVTFGILSFKKEVENLNGKVEERKHEVEDLVGERKQIREQMRLGRRLLEVHQRIEDLEQRLMLAPTASVQDGQPDDSGEPSSSDGETEDGDDADSVGLPRLRKHAESLVYIRLLVKKIGEQHPFLATQEERILRLKQTVLLDLNNALKQTVGRGEEGRVELLEILSIYKQMGEANEAIAVLKEVRPAK